MMKKLLVLFETLIILIMLVSSQAASADETKDKAKEHFLKGRSLVEEGELHDAIEAFEKSYDLNPVPIVLYNIAVCLDELKDYDEAQMYYLWYLQEAGELSEERKAKVQARLDFVGGFLGRLTLVDAPEGAEIWIDGKLRGKAPLEDIALDEGDHTVVLKAEDHPDFVEEITITAGEITSVTVELPEAETPPPDPVEEETSTEIETEPEDAKGEDDPGSDLLASDDVVEKKKLAKTPFIAVASVAGAILATSIVTGSLAYTTHLEFQTKYNEDKSEWRPLQKKSNYLAVTTDVLIGVGSAAAAAAVILAIFTDWGGEKQLQETGTEEGGTSAKLVTSPFVLQGGAGILVQGTF